MYLLMTRDVEKVRSLTQKTVYVYKNSSLLVSCNCYVVDPTFLQSALVVTFAVLRHCINRHVIIFSFFYIFCSEDPEG